MANLHHSVDTFHVRHVPLTRPFIWLRDGWEDMCQHCTASLAYGVLVSLLGALILAYSQHPFYIGAVCIGFLFVGPLLSSGCCELSRRQDEGEQPDFGDSLRPLRRDRGALLHLARVLAMIATVWFLLTGFTYTILGGAPAPGMHESVGGDVFLHLSRAQVFMYLLLAGALAIAVFALSVIAVPMIVASRVDARTAMRASLRVTQRELPAMLVWAALILVLVHIGFSTHLLGMVLIFPLLCHATWRAYRELME